MKMYKLSRYNIVFNRGGVDYLWNTFSGAVIRLTRDGKIFLQEFSEDSTQDSNNDYFNILQANGCIVKQNYDELGKILFDEKAITMNLFPSKMYFTIAPGLSCNYKCLYCFENHRTSYSKMSKSTQNKLLEYIENRIRENRNLKRISITWFGGEPLMYTDIIYYLSKKLIKYCDQHGIEYYSGIISNGRFLNKNNVSLLQECRIGHIQLSIDGMSDYFVKQKNATDIDFYETVRNLEYASSFFPISVRINVLHSIEQAIKLTDYLLKERGLEDRIKVYIAQIREYDKRMSTQEEKKAHGQFLDLENQYMSLFGTRYKKSSFEYRIPKRRGASCLSSCISNPCIGPNGEIYQCEHHFGIKQTEIGSIINGYYYGESNAKYLQFKHYNKCLNCKFFPVCLGGCLDDKVNGRSMINCSKYKNRLLDLIVFNL